MKKEREISSANSTKQNKAAQHFTENNLLDFVKWYTPEVIEYLLHCEDSQMIKYVFYDSDSKNQNFEKQILNLQILKNQLNKDACFISKEPGAGHNHFIFGALIKGSLLIINPFGSTDHKDFYVELNKIKHLFKDGIYISNTKLQLDKEGLSSCGPICVELLKHVSNCSGLNSKKERIAFVEKSGSIKLSQSAFSKSINLTQLL